MANISEPAVARHIQFRAVDENSRPFELGAATLDPFGEPQAKQKGNVGTLFAEIGRLKTELGVRSEKILQPEQELGAIRYAKDTATLSEKLRESERELRIWRQRAQWAETALFRKTGSRTTSGEESG